MNLTGTGQLRLIKTSLIGVAAAGLFVFAAAPAARADSPEHSP